MSVSYTHLDVYKRQTLGCVFPSCIIVLTLAFLYYKYKNLTVIQNVLSGLRPAVVALIASAGMTILVSALWAGHGLLSGLGGLDLLAVGIFAVSLFVLRIWKPNPILVMLGAGAVGLISHFII